MEHRLPNFIQVCQSRISQSDALDHIRSTNGRRFDKGLLPLHQMTCLPTPFTRNPDGSMSFADGLPVLWWTKEEREAGFGFNNAVRMRAGGLPIHPVTFEKADFEPMGDGERLIHPDGVEVVLTDLPPEPEFVLDLLLNEEVKA